MKVLLRLNYETRNVPLPSGTAVLADALLGSCDIEFETDAEGLHREVITRVLEFGSEDSHVTSFQVWILADERIWDEPFEIPEIPPERLAELRAIIDRTRRGRFDRHSE